ncbi:DUF4153 domain-containing protein [Herpetosiphon geysericola]|uniref:Uncharacterized protein n=1 Tax=Herpetosiphon geysericola TaxID=70996 RepID=A0A0P6XE01_9CHLR|nr:DUF4173 domain-containing protein [Herpetosiphon geysericola]KPL81297.1 hypothetical protein SE18_21740 [Herpetosiphon geysericola]
MARQQRLVLALLPVAFGLGLIADLLGLFHQAWGINFGIWTLLSSAAIVGLSFKQTQPLAKETWLWLGIANLASLGFVLRDNEAILVWLGLCWVLAWMLIFTQPYRAHWQLASIRGWIVSGVVAGLGAAFCSFGAALNLPLRGGNGTSAKLRPILIGLGLALPLLCIFGGLFASADAVFENIFADLFNWNLDWLFEHVFVVLFATWAILGCGWILFAAPKPDISFSERPSLFNLGKVEVGIILGLLNALFGLFVVIQIRYLFGGEQQIAEGISYADYARRGFFELVTVALLVLPTLLLGSWLIEQRAEAQPLFRVLALVLLVQVGIVLASAVSRMLLYIDAYGLTESRIQATALMIWIVLVALWFVATVLRQRGHYFANGALVAAMIVLIGLVLLNPSNYIVRYNASHRGVASFDGYYVGSLADDADAVPAIIEVLPSLPAEQSCQIATQLLGYWNDADETDADWRSTNVSRNKARELVRQNAQNLTQMSCPIDRSM